jgi:hypothetical protein
MGCFVHCIVLNVSVLFNGVVTTIKVKHYRVRNGNEQYDTGSKLSILQYLVKFPNLGNYDRILLGL